MFRRAELGSPQDPAVLAEITEVTKLIDSFRRLNGDDRRMEFEARMKRHDSYGLTALEGDLLFEAGVMPWDA